MTLRIVLAMVLFGPLALSCAPKPDVAGADALPQPAKERVVAFYFHGAIRCVTCLDIERVARETVETRFLESIARESLEWRSVDYDADGNAHYKDDYDLSMPSLVLVRLEGESVVEWRNLEETWTHVGDSEDALASYVETELQAFLVAAPA